MEAVLLIGIPASGKSTFYKQRFADTHIRVNLDMLKTRHREKLLIQTCLSGGIPFVSDNTNLAVADREALILQANDAGFRVEGYYFESRVAICLERNQSRLLSRKIPDAGVRDAHRRMEIPTKSEGFNELYYVTMREDGQFSVQDWQDAL